MSLRLPRVEESRALLVGTSKYRHLDDLPAIRNNLASLGHLLTDQHSGSGLLARHCTVMENPPDPKTIYSALRRAASEASDALIFYFAGHGLTFGPNNELYLCARNTESSEAPVTALRYSDVREMLISVRGSSQSQLVILDCCFSGRAIPMMATPEAVRSRMEISGTYILTSTAANRESVAPPGEPYTAFTGALIALLNSGIAVEPELLTLPALFPYLDEALRRRGFPAPFQVGAQTIQNLAIVRNAAKQVSSPSSSTTTAQQVWIRALPGHTRAVRCLAFNPQGSMLASCSSDNTIRLWDLNAWGESRRFTPRRTGFRGLPSFAFDMEFGGLSGIAFDPSGKYLAGLMAYGASIYIWDVETGKRVKKLVGHTGDGYSISYHPFRALLASCAGDGTVRVWNPAERKEDLILSGHAAKQKENANGTVSEEPASVYDVAFDPRRNVLASCADDMTIQLWNPKDGQHICTLTGHSGKVYSLAFHPTADLLASASEDRTIRLWDINTGSQRSILSGHSESVMSVAFNHDGQLFASCDSWGAVRLWNPNTGEQLNEFIAHRDGIFRRGVQDVIFHPQRDILVSCGKDRMIRFWGPF